MLTRVLSAALVGIEPYLVEVEVDLAGGLPAYQLVGLPAAATVEGKVRIRGALENSGFKVPPRKVSVNLAPADVRKDGAAFDLPIAVGIAVAAGLAPADLLADVLLLGELSLDGSIKPVRGALPVAAFARARRARGLILPAACAAEAAVVDGVAVYAARALGEVLAFLAGAGELPRARPAPAGPGPAAPPADFSEVRGQAAAKRALEIAAAGGHNVILVGEPGCGKTMLARRLPSILPALEVEETLAVSTVHSVAGLLGGAGLVAERPFRAPHHSISPAGLVGGGPQCRPGEVSLAHHGVLFLDELPEFARPALEALRQPLEDRHVTIVRARRAVTFPAAFTLVAAANPCPCGHCGSELRACTCSPLQIARYRARLSGPLLDRIDLHVPVAPIPYAELAGAAAGEGSAAIRDRVVRAREIQRRRLAPYGLYCNAQMTTGLLASECAVDALGDEALRRAVGRDGLSARGVDRVRKVARTIADLRGAARLRGADVILALQYRALDRDDVDQPWRPRLEGAGFAAGATSPPSPAAGSAPTGLPGCATLGGAAAVSS
ncbi:MAG TPA: YifB family Mg chelatase-like AAA ATPase [Polyangia bacterium]